MRLDSRGVLWGISAFWVVWLHGVSNVFTMGYYTPLPRKLVLSGAALLIPAILVQKRDWASRVLAVLLVVLTWVPLLLLWLYDRKSYGL